MADCDNVIEGNRKVYRVLTPLPTKQNAMPITHIRRVRQGISGSFFVKPTPAASNNSSVESLDTSGRDFSPKCFQIGKS
jgi:hypothetical protein